MLSVFGTSDAEVFSLIWGWSWGYSTTPFSGKAYEEWYCNILIC